MKTRAILAIVIGLAMASGCSSEISNSDASARTPPTVAHAEPEVSSETSTIPSANMAPSPSAEADANRDAQAAESPDVTARRRDPFFPDEVHEPLIMVVEASDDCVRPRHTLRRFTREYVANHFPVVDLAIRGLLPTAYAQDPTLDLEETIPEEALNPLLWSITMHCHDLLDWLVTMGMLEGEWNARLSYPGTGVLMIEALRVDNTHAVTVLLAHGHDPNASDHHEYPALHYANSAEAVEALITGGADPNPENDVRPIVVAARTGRPQVVEALYPLTDNPSTAIYDVIKEADARGSWRQPIEPLIEVLKTLKRLGADIHVQRPEEVYGAPADAANPIDFAREYGGGRLDPRIMMFLEDWAGEQ